MDESYIFFFFFKLFSNFTIEQDSIKKAIYSAFKKYIYWLYIKSFRNRYSR